jgi:N-methylhydantoinase B
MAAGPALETGVFDGRTYPYRPPLAPPTAVEGFLQTEHLAVDATTFEVLRHALWNVNIEHGNTIVRTSGSPVVVYSHDFNPVILDEWGDYVYFGPWLQYLVAATSPAVKWIIEHRHPAPGIAPDSMFMTNDPWIGATHQSDLAVLAPVFHEGQLFAWVGNSLHHQDLGGTAPGGFNPVAADVYWESGVIPPVRIVENGDVRSDIEDELLRRSRMPAVVSIDLRAQIAGCRVAVRRMETLIDRYGGTVVKGVMRKIQDDSEAAFLRRLETIPDGEWRAEAFLEMATPGDRGLYRNAMVLRKSASRLTFSNEGTDPQTGTLNCTMAGWIGAVAAMVNSQLMFDQLFAVAGPLRHIDFDVEPGSLTCALYPSALSLGVLTIDQCIALAGLCISKMLSCSTDPQLHREVSSSMGAPTFPIAAMSGVDRKGSPFATLFMDPVGAGLAAWAWRDGMDVGGWLWDPQVAMPNVEETEEFYPVLYLWRRLMPDSGGAGEFRGGNAMEFATIPHGVAEIQHHTASAAHHSLPMGALYAGYAGSVNRFELRRDSDVSSAFERHRVPTPETLGAASVEELPPKGFGIPQRPNDVFVLAWAGAGGYGDPLERDAEAVWRDVRQGMVTPAAAESTYGVVMTQAGVDLEATTARREDMRRLRRQWAGKSEAIQTLDTAPVRCRFGPALEIRGAGVDATITCARCATVLGDAGGNWKDGALVHEADVAEANPYCRSPADRIDADVVLRRFACPGCLRLIDGEIRLRSDSFLWDTRLTV